ncbi:hypothetical protein D7W81_04695 [Corallococcus aberystwythensis]|uniref:Uncharacterized protein n=1 Tax=Corallococcus aberystwythensis TaxID=2316722 RepID=A0A3A8R7E3_9BACT|nr:hypothetical protein D7W81_04695 [Corallococcus aberystwythensis]
MPPVCPSDVERGGTWGHGVGRNGMTNPREIKAMAGNSASCLRFPIALPTGSSPVLLATEKGPESKGSGPFAFPAAFVAPPSSSVGTRLGTAGIESATASWGSAAAFASASRLARMEALAGTTTRLPIQQKKPRVG